MRVIGIPLILALGAWFIMRSHSWWTVGFQTLGLSTLEAAIVTIVIILGMQIGLIWQAIAELDKRISALAELMGRR